MRTILALQWGGELWSSGAREALDGDTITGAFGMMRAYAVDGGMSGACGCLACTLLDKKAAADVAQVSPLLTEDGGPQFLGDDIGDNTSTTTSLTIGSSLNSTLNHVGDLDYVRVSLVAGQTYTFALTSTGLADPFIELRNAGGTLLVSDDDNGVAYGSFLTYTATTTGDYYVVARAYNNAYSGSYTLTTDSIETGNTSPTTFTDNGLPYYSWEQTAIQITRDGASWAASFGASVVVTYAFRATSIGMPSDVGGFSQFSAAQIAATEAALAAWAAVANITFVRVGGTGYSDNAAILFGNYSTGEDAAAAFAYVPSEGDTSTDYTNYATTGRSLEGDVWVNNSLSYNANPVIGGYGQQVLLHEIGHALGLHHPGDYNAGNGNPSYPASVDYYGDTRMFTVMSYFDGTNTGGNLPAYASLAQLYDIAAVQRLYGANLATRTGDTIYGFNSNTGVPQYSLTLATQGAVFAVWDGGGNDTLDLSGYSTNSTIDLREESFTTAGPGANIAFPATYNISIARGVTIENAIGGSGSDTIYGNGAANRLNGGGSNDTMRGGGGNDTYVVDNLGDSVIEQASEGTDLVESSVTLTLGANVENLTLTGSSNLNGTGNGVDNVLTGNSGANALSGLDGNDTIDGQTGADTMSGGLGNDTFYVDNAGDTVTENSSEGTDTVIASISLTLGQNLENLTLVGTALNGTGNSLNNIIIGNSQNNVLDGGDGIDEMSGAGGDDTYIVTGQDVITEAAGEGVDTVITSGTWTLGANFENLTATNASGTTWGYGNELNNTLIGGAGANIFDGGAGADAMSGGGGDDTYYVDNVGDTVTELSGEGNDLVWSSVSFVLGQNVDRVVLTGSANLNATGNDLANLLQGNSGANILSGGFGADTIIGNAGADTINYVIGDGSDTVDGGDDIDTFNLTDGATGNILNATYNGAALTVISGNSLTSIETINANMGGGVDWLIYSASAAVTVNLTTGAASGFSSIAGIERVIGGTGDDVITGDGFDNRLDGGLGADTLNGGAGVDTLIGGEGADSLNGGLGNDSVQAGAGADTITWTLGEGRDTIDGGADFDTFNATGTASADLGNVTWNGTALTALIDNGLANLEAVNLNLLGGVDWLIYNASAAVVVNLATNSASGFASVSNIEKVIGGSGDDTLTGDSLDNRLDGLAGADTLDGGAGADAVLGGDGADVIYASAGNDSLQGQNGNDTFIWTSTDGRDTFNGGADVDTVNLTGSAVADVADANWNGSAITGLLNNALVDIEAIHLDLAAGGSGGDWLRYNTSLSVSVDLGAGTGTGFASISGVENLIGGLGGDTLIGDGGANKINGNAGDDVITGGGGADNLTGGAGADTFVYAPGAGNDTILDFDAWADGGQDVLDISAFGINAGNFASRVAIIDTGADTVIRIDDAYFITLKNVTGDGDNSIDQSDFIFGP